MAFGSNPRIGASAHGPAAAARIIYGRYETNSSTFVAGQWVVDDGDAAPGTACITAVASTGTLVLGIAMKDATNVTTGNIEIPVMEIRPGDEIIMKTTASGTAKKSNLFLTNQAYGLYVGSGIVYADFDLSTTGGCVEFLEPIYDSAGNSTYWGKFYLLAASSEVGLGG